MADSDFKKPSIPQWQQKTAEAAFDQQRSSSKEGETSTPTPAGPQREALLDQATKFLQDESVLNESRESKVAFLRSKGLSDDDIQTVLGVSKNTEASDASNNIMTTEEASTASTSPAPSAGDDSSSNSPGVETPSSSQSSDDNSSQMATNSPTPFSTSSFSPSSQQTSASRDVPPIITYPEFLFQPSKPPPLVSIRSVLYSLYSTAAIGTGLYAASEYLVKPMLSNLTNARHELAQTTQEKLRNLNAKLEQNVSIIPPHLSIHPTGYPASDDEEEEDGDDATSFTSDPTELWHRDVATQTSLDCLSSPSVENLADTITASAAKPDPTEKVTSHVERLGSINSRLREYMDSEKQSISLEDGVCNRLTDLHTYLDGLIYGGSYYSAATGYGVFSTPGLESISSASVGVRKDEEDAISNFRSEIRGFKGALLSARNFPAGGTRRSIAGVGVSVGR